MSPLSAFFLKLLVNIPICFKSIQGRTSMATAHREYKVPRITLFVTDQGQSYTIML